MNAILENLPRGRQTLLFSATQTRRVADLARLSLRGPEFIAVHAEAAAPTPVKLQQARRARRCGGLPACCDTRAWRLTRAAVGFRPAELHSLRHAAFL